MNIRYPIYSSLAMLCIASVSCSDQDDPQQADNSVKNTFVVTPADLTRADGDVAVDALRYSVYAEDTGAFLYSDQTSGAPQATFDGNSFSVTLDMVRGESYKVLFWAESSSNTVYTFNREEGVVTADYSKASADGDNDAFFGCKYITSDGEGASVTLYRPFAVVSFGQSPATAESVTDVTLQVQNLPNTLDLTTGAVSGSTTFTTVASGTPSVQYPVNPETTTAIGRFYLLCTQATSTPGIDIVGSGDSSAPTVLHKDMTLSFKAGDTSVTKAFTAIPLQSNYRVNVYGNLLSAE